MAPTQTEQVSILLDDLATYRQKSLLSANGTQVEILAKAQSLIATLETPIESTLRMYWAEVSTFSFPSWHMFSLKQFDSLRGTLLHD